MKLPLRSIGLLLIIGVLVGGAAAQESGNTRPFHMGFTPFPYDIRTEAVEFTYKALAADADLIAHHFDNGVPWTEALADTPYPDALMVDWLYRKLNTPPDHKIYLAITPINLERTGLAKYRGEQEDMPLPTPFDSYSFDHPDVMTAFVNHARRAIDFFQPDYVAIGIEVNLLLTNKPELWNDYTALQEYAYTTLKQEYPDLPIFVSVLGLSLLEGYRPEDNYEAQIEALPGILANSDYFALSLYPYLSSYRTNPYPQTMLDDLFGLADKPIAITETGYPAETLSVFNDTIQFPGTPEKQAAYLADLMAAAERWKLEFIVNFVLRDYDALWEKIGGGDLAAVWRDTGLYDESGNPRPALLTWRSLLARPYSRDD